jgi:hypothetical protein
LNRMNSDHLFRSLPILLLTFDFFSSNNFAESLINSEDFHRVEVTSWWIIAISKDGDRFVIRSWKHYSITSSRVSISQKVKLAQCQSWDLFLMPEHDRSHKRKGDSKHQMFYFELRVEMWGQDISRRFWRKRVSRKQRKHSDQINCELLWNVQKGFVLE